MPRDAGSYDMKANRVVARYAVSGKDGSVTSGGRSNSNLVVYAWPSGS